MNSPGRAEGESYLYEAFGLAIASACPLPELPIANREPDVRIVLERSSIQMEFEGDFRIRREGDAIGIDIKNVARFIVSGGARIDALAQPGADIDAVHAYLFGLAFAILLGQRGMLVFHGAAAAIHGAGIAILGRKGAGKSTFAAALVRAGHPLLSDDIVAIGPCGADGLRIAPGYPQLKVAPASAFLLEEPGLAIERRLSPFGKIVVSPNGGRMTSPAPLIRLYILEEDEEISLEAISPRDAVSELLPHWFATQYGHDMVRALGPCRLMEDCVAIAKSAGIRRLRRPLRFDSLGESIAAIENDLAAG